MHDQLELAAAASTSAATQVSFNVSIRRISDANTFTAHNFSDALAELAIPRPDLIIFLDSSVTNRIDIAAQFPQHNFLMMCCPSASECKGQVPNVRGLDLSAMANELGAEVGFVASAMLASKADPSQRGQPVASLDGFRIAGNVSDRNKGYSSKFGVLLALCDTMSNVVNGIDIGQLSSLCPGCILLRYTMATFSTQIMQRQLRDIFTVQVDPTVPCVVIAAFVSTTWEPLLAEAISLYRTNSGNTSFGATYVLPVQLCGFAETTTASSSQRLVVPAAVGVDVGDIFGAANGTGFVFQPGAVAVRYAWSQLDPGFDVSYSVMHFAQQVFRGNMIYPALNMEVRAVTRSLREQGIVSMQDWPFFHVGKYLRGVESSDELLPQPSNDLTDVIYDPCTVGNFGGDFSLGYLSHDFTSFIEYHLDDNNLIRIRPCFDSTWTRPLIAPRVGYSCVPISDTQSIMFGGRDVATGIAVPLESSLFLLSKTSANHAVDAILISNISWMLMKSNSNSSSSSTSRLVRWDHAMVFANDTNEIVIVGGSTKNGSAASTLETLQWTTAGVDGEERWVWPDQPIVTVLPFSDFDPQFPIQRAAKAAEAIRYSSFREAVLSSSVFSPVLYAIDDDAMKMYGLAQGKWWLVSDIASELVPRPSYSLSTSSFGGTITTVTKSLSYIVGGCRLAATEAIAVVVVIDTNMTTAALNGTVIVANASTSVMSLAYISFPSQGVVEWHVVGSTDITGRRAAYTMEDTHLVSFTSNSNLRAVVYPASNSPLDLIVIDLQLSADRIVQRSPCLANETLSVDLTQCVPCVGGIVNTDGVCILFRATGSSRLSDGAIAGIVVCCFVAVAGLIIFARTSLIRRWKELTRLDAIVIATDTSRAPPPCQDIAAIVFVIADFANITRAEELLLTTSSPQATGSPEGQGVAKSISNAFERAVANSVAANDAYLSRFTGDMAQVVTSTVLDALCIAAEVELVLLSSTKTPIKVSVAIHFGAANQTVDQVNSRIVFSGPAISVARALVDDSRNGSIIVSDDAMEYLAPSAMHTVGAVRGETRLVIIDRQAFHCTDVMMPAVQEAFTDDMHATSRTSRKSHRSLQNMTINPNQRSATPRLAQPSEHAVVENPLTHRVAALLPEQSSDGTAMQDMFHSEAPDALYSLAQAVAKATVNALLSSTSSGPDSREAARILTMRPAASMSQSGGNTSQAPTLTPAVLRALSKMMVQTCGGLEAELRTLREQAAGAASSTDNGDRTDLDDEWDRSGSELSSNCETRANNRSAMSSTLPPGSSPALSPAAAAAAAATVGGFSSAKAASSHARRFSLGQRTVVRTSDFRSPTAREAPHELLFPTESGQLDNSSSFGDVVPPQEQVAIGVDDGLASAREDGFVPTRTAHSERSF